MQYRQLLKELESLSDEKYANFHKGLLKNENIKILGVRVPDLRKIAKKYIDDLDSLLSFPDEYYEVTFLKLTAVSYLEYDKFKLYVDRCVSLIDNWATCDCFNPRCIEKNREDFLPYIKKYISVDGEFYQRFALTCLLHFYVDGNYDKMIFDMCEKCNREYYYVHMAAAWLIAEMLVRHYEEAVDFLLKNSLDRRTHNKAIQKACESFRLSDERKIYLKGIKR